MRDKSNNKHNIIL